MEQTPDLTDDVLQLIWEIVKVEGGLHKRLKARLWQELHSELLSKVPTMSDSRSDGHRYFIYPYNATRWCWFVDDELPDLVSHNFDI
jgi:hypothetical protein